MRLVKRLGTAFLILLAVVVAASFAPVGAVEPKCYWVCDENTPCNTPCKWDGSYSTCGQFGICSGR